MPVKCKITVGLTFNLVSLLGIQFNIWKCCDLGRKTCLIACFVYSYSSFFERKYAYGELFPD